ncbi:MAG: tetratricopeptide repeat protein [Xenococcaceae cyanobacterium]
MIRWILSLLCLLFVFSSTVPVMAQEAEIPSVTEEQLQQGEEIAQKAFEATERGDFTKAEEYWTQLIEKFPSNPAVWSNRGNCRVSQNKLDEAIADFNQAIKLAPYAPDPYLNRGAALEGKGRYQEAIADYNRVLEINPKDAMAYNNRGNAKGGQGSWEEALADYQKAADLAPNFAFARANAALTLYQTGEKEKALRTMGNLVRKYPMFPDMRAALTAVLWEQGKEGEAESNWVAAIGIDNRYQDLDWVKTIRRWPPQMVAALERFLNFN